MQIRIEVNGQPRELAGDSTVADLVATLPHRGVAVAVNGAVVPRARHAERRIEAGDRIEIVTAVQGG